MIGPEDRTRQKQTYPRVHSRVQHLFRGKAPRLLRSRSRSGKDNSQWTSECFCGCKSRHSRRVLFDVPDQSAAVHRWLHRQLLIFRAQVRPNHFDKRRTNPDRGGVEVWISEARWSAFLLEYPDC